MSVWKSLAAIWRRSPEQGVAIYTLSMAVLVVGLTNLAIVVVAYTSSRLDFPAYDTWDFLEWWAQADSLPALLWHQYEHHRLVIVNLLMVLDQTVLFGNYALPFVVTLGAVLGVTLYLFLFQMAGVLTDRLLWRAQFALAVAVIFAVTNQEGFVHPYRAWTPLTLAMAAVAVTLLARASVGSDQSAKGGVLAGACLLAAATNVTGAPGILIWPTFLCVLVLVRAPWWTWVSVVVAGVGFSTMYFWDYAAFLSNGVRGGVENLWHPYRLFLSFLTRLGAPFGQTLFVAPVAQFSGLFSLFVGGVTLSGVAFVLISALIRKTRSVAEISLLGLMIFAFGHICAATIKHTPLYPEPWDQFVKSSDFMPAMVVWACLWALVALGLQAYGRMWPRVIFTGLVAAQLLLLLPMQIHGGFAASKLKQEARVGVLSFLAGVREDTNLQQLIAPVSVEEGAPVIRAFIRERRLAPLADPIFRNIDQMREDLLAASLPVCDGGLVQAMSAYVAGGIRFFGTWSALGNGAAAGVLVLDRDGRVVGVGEPFTAPRLGFALKVSRLPEKNGWIAYAHDTADGGHWITGVDKDGRALCQFR